MSGRLLVGCRVSIPYYIYKSGAAIGCRCSSGVGGAAHALQLSGVGCADHVGAVVSWSGLVAHLVGVSVAHVGRLSVVRDWLRILSGCRLVVSWSGCCCPHVGRFSVLMVSGCCSCSPIGCRCLSHLVGVSVASDGVRCCPHIGSRAGCSCSPIGCRCLSHLVGVSVAHALQMSGGCRGHLVGIGCRCSSLSVGRGVGVLFGWLPVALRGAFVLTY